LIVRVMGEGQYEVSSNLLDQLNESDMQLVLAVADNDHEKFRELYLAMLNMLRTSSKNLSTEALRPSDVILPAADIDFADAKSLFVGEGLLPG